MQSYPSPGPGSPLCVSTSLTSPAVLAGRPSPRSEIFFADRKGLVLKWRAHRIVPAVEEAEHGNNANDLLLGPVLAQLGKHLIGDRAWHRARRDRDVKRRALRLAVERAHLVIPDRGDLLFVYAEMHRTACRMGHAVLASRRPARDMCDQALEAPIDFAVRV